MYCPSCGSEERQASQFCRACGVDLRAVRITLERPDSITASAISAREEIGRAVADRIRAARSKELSTVAEEVLPEIEKFLESPEEKRLRRVRAGVVFSAIGIGTATMGLIWSSVANAGDVEGAVIVGGLGIVAFVIGLAIVLNGLLFTRLHGTVADRSSEARRQDLIDSVYTPPQISSAETPKLRSPTTSDRSPSTPPSN
jgi:hypothetical protein